MHKPGAFFFVCTGLLGLALLPPRPAAAGWPTDPTVNVPLCTAPNDQGFSWRPQRYTAILPDGAGGAIVTWADGRSTSYDVYTQRISSTGTIQWTTDGVALCAAAGHQYDAVIVSDGAGGAIVAWTDGRSATGDTDIYAQRISADGTVQWTTGGVALCTASAIQEAQTIVSDGAGGAIVTWNDYRSGSNYDIYAQRISAAGTIQWATDGVALSTATGSQAFPMIVSDGASGAIVTWQDEYSGDICAQRISAAGTAQWTANGVALCTAAGYQRDPGIVSDGTGGAIVAWHDEDSGDVYAQRISAGGVVQWTTNGVALCTAVGPQGYPVTVSDGAGGAIVTWNDYRSSTNYDIYAQRVSATGAVQWTTDGVAISTAAGDQSSASIASDGASGAIATWHDYRSGSANPDIYAQRILADGTVLWTPDGVALGTAADRQESPMIISYGACGAIVAWQDRRSGDFDIYAQRVQANGQLGGTADVPGGAELALALGPAHPNPTQGDGLAVHFTLPRGTAASLELLDVAGRRIATREVGALGAGHHTFDLGESRQLAPGLYLVRLRQGMASRVTRVVVLK